MQEVLTDILKMCIKKKHYLLTKVYQSLYVTLAIMWPNIQTPV